MVVLLLLIFVAAEADPGLSRENCLLGVDLDLIDLPLQSRHRFFDLFDLSQLMGQHEYLIFYLAEFGFQVLKGQVLVELASLLLQKILLIGRKLNVEGIVDPGHLLRCKVVVLFQGINPLYFLEEVLPHLANTALDFTVLGSKLFHADAKLSHLSRVLLLLFDLPLLPLASCALILLHESFHVVDLGTEVIGVGVIDVEGKVVAVFGQLLPDFAKLVVVPAEGLSGPGHFTLEICLGGNLRHHLIQVSELIHKLFLEGLLIILGSPFEFLYPLDFYQLKPQLVLLDCKPLLRLEDILPQLLPVVLQSPHIFIEPLVEVYHELLNLPYFLLLLLYPDHPLLGEVIFRRSGTLLVGLAGVLSFPLP